MEKLSLLGIIFMSLPEGILITLVALELINVRIKFRQLLLIGVLHAFFAFYIRQYAPNVIFNLLGQATVNLMLAMAVARVRFVPYVIGLALSYSVYITLESSLIGIIIPALNLPIYVIMANLGLRIIIFSFQAALFFGIYIIIKKFKLHIIGDSSGQR